MNKRLIQISFFTTIIITIIKSSFLNSNLKNHKLAHHHPCGIKKIFCPIYPCFPIQCPQPCFPKPYPIPQPCFPKPYPIPQPKPSNEIISSMEIFGYKATYQQNTFPIIYYVLLDFKGTCMFQQTTYSLGSDFELTFPNGQILKTIDYEQIKLPTGMRCEYGFKIDLKAPMQKVYMKEGKYTFSIIVKNLKQTISFMVITELSLLKIQQTTPVESGLNVENKFIIIGYDNNSNKITSDIRKRINIVIKNKENSNKFNRNLDYDQNTNSYLLIITFQSYGEWDILISIDNISNSTNIFKVNIPIPKPIDPRNVFDFEIITNTEFSPKKGHIPEIYLIAYDVNKKCFFGDLIYGFSSFLLVPSKTKSEIGFKKHGTILKNNCQAYQLTFKTNLFIEYGEYLITINIAQKIKTFKFKIVQSVRFEIKLLSNEIINEEENVVFSVTPYNESNKIIENENFESEITGVIYKESMTKEYIMENIKVTKKNVYYLEKIINNAGVYIILIKIRGFEKKFQIKVVENVNSIEIFGNKKTYFLKQTPEFYFVLLDSDKKCIFNKQNSILKNFKSDLTNNINNKKIYKNRIFTRKL